MQKKNLLLGTFLILTIFNFCYGQEPSNLSLIKKELIAYHDSGKYQKDINTVVNHAIDYLKLRTQQPHQEKLAIVLDIDETSLSNYSDMKKFNFGGTRAENDKAVDQGHDPVIQKTLTLYRLAKSNNIAVFFVTGRGEKDRPGTIHNLLKVGYKNWNGLYFKPANYPYTSAQYKIATRKNIENHGYKIILNLGDQKSDLVGGYAEKTFKLPNPYYFIA